jgi:aminoglycoside phosphotransferase
VDVIALSDGRLVELGESAANGSKNETRFGRLNGQPVVVKTQRSHDNPREEELALRFLNRAGLRVPQVIGSGTAVDGRPLLVISRESGSHSETPEGWERFGRDLAALLDVPVAGCPFRRVSASDFVADHHERLVQVRQLLTHAQMSAIEDSLTRVGVIDRLVVTHGDPGTGNYLDAGDDQRAGVLLDWETATVSPIGLDLGRAAFICMLDLRRSGISDQLVPALIRGYTQRSELSAQTGGALLHAWVIVAALQFIHGRHTRPLVPERTPQAAAKVLERYLASTR